MHATLKFITTLAISIVVALFTLGPTSGETVRGPTVMVVVVVSPEGKVTDTKVVQSSGLPDLDKAVQAKLWARQYDPLIEDGTARESRHLEVVTTSCDDYGKSAELCK